MASIKEDNYETKLAELKLDLRNPLNKNKVIILLEGETDIKLWRKLVNKNVQLESLTGGNIKLTESLFELFPRYTRLVIGVRDADFLHLQEIDIQAFSAGLNLFFTDYHDIEMQMAVCDNTLNAVLFEHTNDDADTHFYIRENVLKALEFISCVRYYNELNQVDFNFKGLNFGELLDKNECKIDKLAYIQKLMKVSPQAKISNKSAEELIPEIDLLVPQNEENNLFQLCNGHDFMNVLGAELSKNLKKNLSGETLESYFRIAYSLENFKKTSLYTHTQTWATQNNCSIYEP